MKKSQWLEGWNSRKESEKPKRSSKLVESPPVPRDPVPRYSTHERVNQTSGINAVFFELFTQALINRGIRFKPPADGGVSKEDDDGNVVTTCEWVINDEPLLIGFGEPDRVIIPAVGCYRERIIRPRGAQSWKKLATHIGRAAELQKIVGRNRGYLDRAQVANCIILDPEWSQRTNADIAWLVEAEAMEIVQRRRVLHQEIEEKLEEAVPKLQRAYRRVRALLPNISAEKFVSALEEDDPVAALMRAGFRHFNRQGYRKQ